MIIDAFSITDISYENVDYYTDLIYLLIEDLKELSHSSKIHILKPGHCRKCIRVGDYALAFGAIDEYTSNPDPAFSNAILFHKEFPDEDFEIIVSLYLKTSKRKKDRIDMYHKIRDAQKRWYDAEFDNFGIVPNDFIHPFSEVSVEGLRNLGIEDCFVEYLMKGETRLIDHGYILPEDEEPMFPFKMNLIYYLENEYEESKSLKKKY